MSLMTPVISNFVRGELSPRMEGRSDAEAFYQGLAKLENALVLPQGGVEKRPGTIYVDTVQDTSKASRLIPFVVNEEKRYILELYDGGIRIFQNDDGAHTARTTKYTLTLDVAPASDWTVGTAIAGQTSGTRAYVLAKVSGTEWIISEPDGTFTDGEVLRGLDSDGNDEDADQGAGYPTVSTSTVTNIVQQIDSASFFDADDLALVKYVQAGRQMVFTCRNKQPKLLTWLNDTGWLWTNFKISVPEWQPADEEVVPVSISALDLAAIFDQGTKPWQPETQFVGSGYEKGEIVKYSGSFYRCLNDVLSDSDPATDTTNWLLMTTSPHENPFDTAGAYPASCAYFQDRVIFGGTDEREETFWGSATGKYQMFILGPLDGDAWRYSLLSDRSDKIQWISSREVLIIGTTGGEWVIGGGQAGITPRTVLAKRQTTFGSADIQGTLINENIVFVQKGARKLREYYYQNELQAYRAGDLTFWSDHITGDGVRELAFSSDPDPILWVLRTDGVLLSLTYDKVTRTMGWARHITDGEIESIAVIPAGNEDELWMTVKRTIDGSATRYLEYMSARYQNGMEDRHHVDAGTILDGGESFELEAATAADPVSVTATAHGLSTGDRVRITDVTGMTELEGRTFLITVVDVNTFTLDNEDGTGRDPATAGTMVQVYAQVTGLTHLEGETVNVAVDGGPHAQRTVSSGTITLDDGRYGNVIHVGLPFTMELQTMNIMAAVAEAKKGRMHAVRARFIDTVQAKAGYDAEALEEIIFREPSTPYGEPTQLFTGEKNVPLGGDYDNDQRVTIESAQPVPCTVAVILPELGAYRGGQ